MTRPEDTHAHTPGTEGTDALLVVGDTVKSIISGFRYTLSRTTNSMGCKWIGISLDIGYIPNSGAFIHIGTPVQLRDVDLVKISVSSTPCAKTI